MKTEAILYTIIFVLGLTVLIAPWTFAPVCITEMRCWFTRDVMTILGAAISLVAAVGMYTTLATE